MSLILTPSQQEANLGATYIASVVFAISFVGLVYLIMVINNQSQRIANLSYFAGLTLETSDPSNRTF